MEKRFKKRRYSECVNAVQNVLHGARVGNHEAVLLLQVSVINGKIWFD
jgi:hypothetical protein